MQAEPLSAEVYLENEAQQQKAVMSPVRRDNLRMALQLLDGTFGIETKVVGDQSYRITGVPGINGVFGLSEEVLERDFGVSPLTVLSGEVRLVCDALRRPGERLPFVTASAQDGAFRATCAFWVGEQRLESTESVEVLLERLSEWDGVYPDPGRWLAAEEEAKRRADERLTAMMAGAASREQTGLRRQVEAARIRLLRELGRYLVSVVADTATLNQTLHYQIQRPDIASRERLQSAQQRLGGGYPDWPEFIVRELREFIKTESANERKGRLIGSEIDAALADPRWAASEVA